MLIPLSLAANSLHLYNTGLKTYATLGLFGFIASLGVWLIGGPVNGLKEIIAVTGLILWQMPLGYWMRRQVDEDED